MKVESKQLTDRAGRPSTAVEYIPRLTEEEARGGDTFITWAVPGSRRVGANSAARRRVAYRILRDMYATLLRAVSLATSSYK